MSGPRPGGVARWALEAILAIVGSTIGVLAYLKVDSASDADLVKVLAIPISAAVVVGLCFRGFSPERFRFGPALIVLMPVCHVAVMVSVSLLATVRVNPLEKSPGFVAPLLWSDWRVLLAAASLEMVALSLFGVFARNRVAA